MLLIPCAKASVVGTRTPIDVDKKIAQLLATYKLVRVMRDDFLLLNQIKVQLDMSYGEAVHLLLELSGIDFKVDLYKDARVREALRRLNKGVM